jgi:hypothetical protein
VTVLLFHGCKILRVNLTIYDELWRRKSQGWKLRIGYFRCNTLAFRERPFGFGRTPLPSRYSATNNCERQDRPIVAVRAEGITGRE